jgi:CheY-like chemotaxis protein
VPLPPARQPLRILLAEDNKVNQKFAAALLAKAGHSVEIAENGHQAVDAVRRSDFDVVLMDIQMPELDGVEATKQIRMLDSAKRNVHIVAMTAHAMAGAAKEYLAAGMNDYISKPVDPKLMVAKLDAIGGSQPAPAVPVHNGNVAPVLDIAKLSELSAALPAENLTDMLHLYLTDTDLSLQRLARARARGDLEACGREAHGIVSMSGNFGAMKTCAAAQALEAACRYRDKAAVYPLIGVLGEACAESGDALRIWMKGALPLTLARAS